MTQRTAIRIPHLVLTMVVIGGFVLGCNKTADLAKYKDLASSLASQYMPKLAHLGGKIEGLLGRVKSLPASVPGVAEVNKLLAENQGAIDQLKGLISNLPNKIAEKPAEAQKVLDTTKHAMDEGFSKVTSSIASADAKVGELETQTKAVNAADSDA